MICYQPHSISSCSSCIPQNAASGVRQQVSAYSELRDNLSEGLRFYTSLQVRTLYMLRAVLRTVLRAVLEAACAPCCAAAVPSDPPLGEETRPLPLSHLPANHPPRHFDSLFSGFPNPTLTPISPHTRTPPTILNASHPIPSYSIPPYPIPPTPTLQEAIGTLRQQVGDHCMTRKIQRCGEQGKRVQELCKS